MTVSIRPALLEEAPFVAWAVITAVGIDNPDEKLLSNVTKLCCLNDVLYSWRNTLLAENNGNILGSLTCYNGADYMRMRKVTFPIIKENTGMDFSNMDLETSAGEFYLDSMSVLPEFRHQGVATALLKAGIEKAENLGIDKVSMIVSPENTAARHLYESLGFRFSHGINAFNETYLKMVKIR